MGDVTDRLNRTSLQNLSLDDARLSASLSAYWDTLGWILFQKGDLGKAEQYVQAAWCLRAIGAIGDHLGQILEKEGRKQEAAQAYAEALSATAPITETKERLAAVIGPNQGLEPLLEKGRADLAKGQQVQVKNKAGGEGLAEFWLLLVPDGNVADVKFVSGDEVLRRSADDLRGTEFPEPFPDGSKVQLIRRVKLVCARASVPCTARLVSAEAIRSLN